jgi:lipopolysaccharide transport system permease protein
LDLNVTVDAPEHPRATVVIRPARGAFGRNVRELWPYRELAYFLVWRDVKVRYKQTVLGAAWAIIQPLLLMVVFSVFLGHFAKLPSNDLPYPIFSYAALVPWTLFASALAAASDSMVGNSNLVSKVYFPRLVLPIAGVLAPLVDFCIAFLMLGVLMVWYGVAPTRAVVVLPLLVVLALTTALGVGIWLASLNVRYRDFKYVVPFLSQFWLFATPVAYATTLIPRQWWVLYGLNPMASVVEGFRWALLNTAAPPLGMLAVSGGVAGAALLSGLLYFQRVERTFADLI